MRPRTLAHRTVRDSPTPVFVLIHSPLVGPTTWSPLVRELDRRGREAVVPSLLGIADAPPPQWRHAPEAVHAATAQVTAPVVVVGHSGAGLLLRVIADAVTAEVAALTELPGAHHLSMVTDVTTVTDALLELEGELLAAT